MRWRSCIAKTLLKINLPNTIADPQEYAISEWARNHIGNMLYHLGMEDKFEEYQDFDKVLSEAFGIGTSAFEGCTSLTTVNIPKYMTKLAPRTFKGCTSLETIVLPYGLEMIGAEAFAESGLVEIVIPETVLKLGTAWPDDLGEESSGGGKDDGGKDGGRKGETFVIYGSVFANCTSLKSVVFEGVVDDVYFDTFKGCTALESVTFATGWTQIADGMFAGCTSLNIELPASIEMVGAGAFEGWTAEQTITISIPASTADLLWGEGWNYGATVVEK